MEFYWQLGTDIVEKQKTAVWGSGFLKQLSKDLIVEFPDIKGFSLRNIKYIRQWVIFYSNGNAIGQQAVAQLEDPINQQIFQIPWGHNIAIISKSESFDEAIYYVINTQQHHNTLDTQYIGQASCMNFPTKNQHFATVIF